jgi:hypothetical protein
VNTTIRDLVVALPLATAALVMTPGVAQADGPVIVLPPPGGDPQGPVIANPTPGHDPVDPSGPGDLTAPQPCPTHGACSGHGGGQGNPDGGPGDNGGDNGGGHGPTGNQGGTKVSSIALPTRIDAGLAAAAHQDSNLQLTWALAGGALVTASGAAFAARRRVQANA